MVPPVSSSLVLMEDVVPVRTSASTPPMDNAITPHYGLRQRLAGSDVRPMTPSYRADNDWIFCENDLVTHKTVELIRMQDAEEVVIYQMLPLKPSLPLSHISLSFLLFVLWMRA